MMTIKDRIAGVLLACTIGITIGATVAYWI